MRVPSGFASSRSAALEGSGATGLREMDDESDKGTLWLVTAGYACLSPGRLITCVNCHLRQRAQW